MADASTPLPPPIRVRVVDTDTRESLDDVASVVFVPVADAAPIPVGLGPAPDAKRNVPVGLPGQGERFKYGRHAQERHVRRAL